MSGGAFFVWIFVHRTRGGPFSVWIFCHRTFGGAFSVWIFVHRLFGGAFSVWIFVTGCSVELFPFEFLFAESAVEHRTFLLANF